MLYVETRVRVEDVGFGVECLRFWVEGHYLQCSRTEDPAEDPEKAGHAKGAPPGHQWSARQSKHGPPGGPKNPSSHTQSVLLLLEAGAHEFATHARHPPVAPTPSEKVSSPHAVHPPEPAAPLYVPAGQAAQTPPSAPVNPARQIHAATPTLPSGDEVPPGQGEHADACAESPLGSGRGG